MPTDVPQLRELRPGHRVACHFPEDSHGDVPGATDTLTNRTSKVLTPSLDLPATPSPSA